MGSWCRPPETEQALAVLRVSSQQRPARRRAPMLRLLCRGLGRNGVHHDVVTSGLAGDHVDIRHYNIWGAIDCNRQRPRTKGNVGKRIDAIATRHRGANPAIRTNGGYGRPADGNLCCIRHDAYNSPACLCSQQSCGVLGPSNRQHNSDRRNRQEGTLQAFPHFHCITTETSVKSLSSEFLRRHQDSADCCRACAAGYGGWLGTKTNVPALSTHLASSRLGYRRRC